MDKYIAQYKNNYFTSSAVLLKFLGDNCNDNITEEDETHIFRKCKVCNCIKQISEFTCQPSSRLRLHRRYRCKPCTSAWVKQYKLKRIIVNPETGCIGVPEHTASSDDDVAREDEEAHEDQILKELAKCIDDATLADKDEEYHDIE